MRRQPSYEKLVLLQAAFERGETAFRAARLLSLSPSTTYRKYREFRAMGLVQPARTARMSKDPPRKFTRWRTQPYTGPDWIG